MISAVSSSIPGLRELQPFQSALASQRAAKAGKGEEQSEAASTGSASPANQQPPGKSELTDDEQRAVQELQRRDAEVRRHEAAHKAAAGSNAKGGATFEYQTGPDGRQYAVGGEVQIDVSEVPGDPQATITKMQQIRRAANAPANPSSQDRAVAARAAQLEQQARRELSQQKQTDQEGSTQPGRFIDVTA